MVRRHEREGQPLKRLLRTLTPTGGGSSHARHGDGAARRGGARGSAAVARRQLRPGYTVPRAAAAGGPAGGMLGWGFVAARPHVT